MKTAVTESFLTTALLVEHTDRIAVVQGRLAQSLLGGRALRILRLSFDAVPLVQALWWHSSHEVDGSHRVLRDCLKDAASLCGAHGPPVIDAAEARHRQIVVPLPPTVCQRRTQTSITCHQEGGPRRW